MNRTTEHINIGLARKLGNTIIPTWRLENRELARHLAQVFERYAITTVFDVGANIGQYHDFLSSAGRIHGAGAFLRAAACISSCKRPNLQQRQTGDPAWVIHNLVLGSSNGELALNVMSRDTFSSFRAAR